MEKEANQLYRRPQMTGQARDEEDNQLYQRPQMTGQARDEEENVRIVFKCLMYGRFILRLVLFLYLFLYLLCHCVALLDVNTTEQSFTSYFSV